MNRYLFTHEVDQSLLKAGVTIPLKIYHELFDYIEVDLKKGEKAKITILVKGEEYDAELVFQNVKEDRNLIQIRYGQSDPIAERLRDIFSSSNQIIDILKETGEAKYPNTLIAEEQKEHINVIAIGKRKLQFECFPKIRGHVQFEKGEIVATDVAPVINAGKIITPDQLFGMIWDADTIAMFPPDAIYFVPVNLNEWDLFNKVDGPGHFETFIATKGMKQGDMLLLYVGKQKERVESGIYAFGRILKGPFILSGAPDDYCNGKLTVLARIEFFRKDKPIFNMDECKKFNNQFRSTHKLKTIDLVEFDNILRKKCWDVEIPDGLTEEEEKEFAQGLDLTSLEQLARKRSGTPKKVYRNNSQETIQFQRDQFISEYAKRRADGKCQLCGKTAPFYNKKGQPYLESHHVIWLSEGGEDSVDNVVALCPNCHRKMHILNDPEDVKYLIGQNKKPE